MAKDKFLELPEGMIVPNHIGIIMDGNGRWAQKRGLPRNYGHKKGADSFKEATRYCNFLGVKYLTVYAFSTENWKRPQAEIDAIMDLLDRYLDDAMNYIDENVRLKFVGDFSPLTPEMIEKIHSNEKESDHFTGLTLNIALNYGGRDEILNATKKLAMDVKENKIDVNDIDFEKFENYLYNSECPDADLILRPSGEYRLSNFLLWQSAYAELVFNDILWPDFKAKHLRDAIIEFNHRNRRFGGI